MTGMSCFRNLVSVGCDAMWQTVPATENARSLLCRMRGDRLLKQVVFRIMEGAD